jgi:hypothetical protein
MAHVTSPTSLAVDVPQGRKIFVFDRVFSESVDQEGVWDYLSDSVNSFTQGYNVSILAYGQSGAGKSYTMGTSGPQEQNDSKAMGKQFSFFTSSVDFSVETPSVSSLLASPKNFLEHILISICRNCSPCRAATVRNT